jgi:hypothetical protein
MGNQGKCKLTGAHHGGRLEAFSERRSKKMSPPGYLTPLVAKSWNWADGSSGKNRQSENLNEHWFVFD